MSVQARPSMTAKKARSILRANHVDSQYVRIVAGPKSLMLSGFIIRTDGGDMSFEAMEKVHQELMKLGRIQSQLDNWDLNGRIRKTANVDDD